MCPCCWSWAKRNCFFVTLSIMGYFFFFFSCCARVETCSLLILDGLLFRSGTISFARVLVSSESFVASSLCSLIDFERGASAVEREASAVEKEASAVVSVAVVVLTLVMVFVVDFVVDFVVISFFFENVPNVKGVGDGAVIVVLEPKGTGGVSFPMVGMHVEFSS